IRLTGFLGSRERAELLASTSFGIHARPAEAFGIAVAEMAGAGCLPFVPNLGGPAEIVSDPDLRYRDESDAVEKIVALLGSPELQRSKRESLAIAMERFRPERFVESLLDEIGHFLEPAVPSERRNQLPEIAPPSR
ncbi:MAG: hypothetical protein KDM64_17215, partial [Verrucomicrobiae bacterium]|nr:hypothetical protein [Verrucomicrobiae bacterium]